MSNRTEIRVTGFEGQGVVLAGHIHYREVLGDRYVPMKDEGGWLSA